MNTPDFTAAQFVAVVGAVVATAVAFGVTLTDAQRGAILGSVLVWADMKIRQHRAENAGNITPKPGP